MILELNPNLQSVETIFLNIAGCIDLFANSLLIYFILFKSAAMQNFRFYMLYFQMTTFVIDIYLAFLMKPIPLYPLVGGYTTGLLATVFHVSSHVQMTIILVLMNDQLLAIACSFLKKHQTIVAIDGRKVFDRRVYWSLIVFFHLVGIGGCVPFYFCVASKDDQLEYIRNKIPNLESELAQFPTLEIYDRDNNPLVLYSLLILLVLEFFYFTCVFVLCLDIFITLQKNRLTASRRNMEKHRAMFSSLLAQFSVLLFCFLPASLVLIFMIFEIPNVQEVSSAMVCTFSIHSFLGCLVMIYTYQPYRKIVLLWLGISKKAKTGPPSSSTFFVIRRSGPS